MVAGRRNSQSNSSISVDHSIQSFESGYFQDESIERRKLFSRFQEPMEALIVVDGPIDRETIDRYPFVLTVRDQGNPSLSTSFSLSIDVLDENDHCPEFHFDNSFLMINRDLPIDRYVLDLNATDRDLDENGRLTFQLLSSSIFNFGQILPNGTFIVDLNKVSTINESFVVVHFQIRDHGQPVPCKIIESFRLFIGSNQTDWLKVLETQQNRFETDSTSVNFPRFLPERIEKKLSSPSGFNDCSVSNKNFRPSNLLVEIRFLIDSNNETKTSFSRFCFRLNFDVDLDDRFRLLLR